jgi:hypothetical protein
MTRAFPSNPFFVFFRMIFDFIGFEKEIKPQLLNKHLFTNETLLSPE